MGLRGAWAAPALGALALAAAGCSRAPRARLTEDGIAPEQAAAFLEQGAARAEAAYQLIRLGEALRHFQQDLGRNPDNLAELVRLGYLPEIPVHPEGGEYVLNVSVRGVLPADIVRIAPPDAEAGDRPGEPVPVAPGLVVPPGS